MEAVCPICNGLKKITYTCPICKETLIDGGKIENFWGPYAPYTDMDDMGQQPKTYCTHLLFCAHCHFDIRQSWNLISI